VPVGYRTTVPRAVPSRHRYASPPGTASRPGNRAAWGGCDPQRAPAEAVGATVEAVQKHTPTEIMVAGGVTVLGALFYLLPGGPMRADSSQVRALRDQTKQ